MFVLWWRGGSFLNRAAAKTNVMLLPQKLVVTAPLFFSLTRETLLSWIFFLDENMNCVVSKWSKWIPTSLQVRLALVVAHCTSPVYIVYWNSVQKKPIIACSPCIGCKVTGKVKQIETKVVIDQARCLVCLTRLWSALLWHCSGMRFYTLQYIAWLTQY